MRFMTTVLCGVATRWEACCYLLPCLIERKAKVDIVDSMTDGRWDRQKAQIQAVARKLWPPGSRSSSKFCPRSVYILEGDENILGPDAYNEVYNCECFRKCGGLYGGCVSRGVPTAMHVREKLRDLVHGEGPYMHVEVTKDGLHTGLYLSRIAMMLSNEVARNGGSPSRAGGVKMNEPLYETLKLISRQFTVKAWKQQNRRGGSSAAASSFPPFSSASTHVRSRRDYRRPRLQKLSPYELDGRSHRSPRSSSGKKG